MPPTFTSLRRPALLAAGLLLAATALTACAEHPPGNPLPAAATTSTAKATKSSSTTTTSKKSNTSTSAGSTQSSTPGSQPPSADLNGSVPLNTTTTAPLAASAAGPVCKKSQLSITQSSGTIEATAYVGGFTITNTSKTRCSLNGFPALLIVGKLGPLATHVTNGSVAGQKAYTATTVSLAPKVGEASFLASWNPISSTAAPSCPDGTGIIITLPGVTGGIGTQTTVVACGGLVNVTPIQPNVI